MSVTPMDVSATTRVEAPVERVWEVVSDVRRMPEFSPEVRRVLTFGGSGTRMRLVGINRRGLAVWPTMSRIVRWDPEKAIAWKVRESGATWLYELEPADDGGTATTLTARRLLPRFSLGTTLLGPVIGGAELHDRELSAGLATTLERMKASIEA